MFFMKTRREFLTTSILAGAGLALAGRAVASSPANPFSINVFSKNLQWLDYNTMASVAAEIGFEGIDLTVRPGGHVLPERVKEDLPRAVEAIRKAGLQVPMITTAILSADEPHTESILKTAGSLGIASYRLGWMRYSDKMSIEDNLQTFEEEFQKLDALNHSYNIRAEYQNHSGEYLGSPVWDVARILKKFDSSSIGLQYDVLHATVEGANAWPLALKQIATHVTSMPVKDFEWTKKDGKAVVGLVPLGQGIVDFKKYFGLLKSLEIEGPFSMHFEYPLGGVENGATKLTITEKEVTSAMKRDVVKFREMLKEAGIRN
jgi:L-ribulose-5-phosphate 3-epimerase